MNNFNEYLAEKYNDECNQDNASYNKLTIQDRIDIILEEITYLTNEENLKYAGEYLMDNIPYHFSKLNRYQSSRMTIGILMGLLKFIFIEKKKFNHIYKKVLLKGLVKENGRSSRKKSKKSTCNRL